MLASFATKNEAAASKLDTRIALLMLTAVGGTCLILGSMAHDQRVQDWICRVSWEQSVWKKQIPVYSFNNHFIEFDDRLLHEEIPAADYSRGGVYFMGASNTKLALKTWDLPRVLRPLIRNFGFGGSTHSEQFEMVRFLIEQQGLLGAGGEKTLFVLGVNYQTVKKARVSGEESDGFFTQFWTRHGFYSIDPDGTIRPSGLNRFRKMLILERTKLTGLVREVVNLAWRPFKPVRVHDHQLYNQVLTISMGPKWEEKIQIEVAAIARMVAYLRHRHVNVLVIRMPQGSWEGNVPFESAYIRQVRDVCDRAGVKVNDFSKLVDDDDFADSNHLAPSGMVKFQRAVMGICVDHLRSTGALPPNYTE